MNSTLNKKPMVYTLLGKPIPLKRPQFSTKPFPHGIDTQKALKEEARYDILSQAPKPTILDGPLHLDVTFYMQIPKSYRPNKRTKMQGTLHDKRPDASNLLKFLEDTIQGILIKDDSTITTITARKIYDKLTRTEFTIVKDTYGEEKTTV